MTSTTIRRMLSTPSPSAPLLVLLLPSPWAAPPKQIVSPLRHLVDRCLSPTLGPPMVSSWLTPWATPPRPFWACMCFPLISLLVLCVGSSSLYPWVTPPKSKAALQQSVIADRSMSPSSCVGKTLWTTWSSLQPWPLLGSSRTSCSKGGVKCHV
jgi:hypothetical protein